MNREWAITRRIRRAARRKLGWGVRARKWQERQAKSLKRAIGGVALTVLVPAGVAFWLGAAGNGWMMVLLFSALVSTLICAANTNSSLHDAIAAEFACFPIADDEVLIRVWRHRIPRLLPVLAAFVVWYGAAAACAAWEDARPIDWAIVPLAAVAHMLLIVSLAMVWTANAPTYDLPSVVYLALTAIMAMVLVGGRWIGGAIAPAVEWLLLVLPTGWVAGAFLASQSQTTVPLLVYSVLAAIVIALLPQALRRARRDYAIAEVEFSGPTLLRAVSVREQQRIAELENILAVKDDAKNAGDATADLMHRADGPPTSRRISKSELRAEVSRTLEWDAPLAADDWMERFVFARLSWRERLVAIALLDRPIRPFAVQHAPGQRSWGRQWTRGAATLAALLLLVCVVPLNGGWKFAAFAPALIATMQAAPVFGGSWGGLGFAERSLSLMTLPVSYREISRVVLLLNRLRLAVWTPWAIVGAALGGWKAGFGMADGAIWGIKAMSLAIALQPVIFAVRINENGKDQSRLFGAILTAVMVIVLGGGVIASLVALFMHEWQWSVLGAVGLFVAAQLVLLWDCWRFERGRVDLVRKVEAARYWGG